MLVVAETLDYVRQRERRSVSAYHYSTSWLTPCFDDVI
jgi:hypothetical protein